MSARIYTKQGDRGQTSLACGTKVSKGDLRLEVYGTVDELNSLLGVISAESKALSAAHSDIELETIQNYLFTIGSHLACEDEKMQLHLPALDPAQVSNLEMRIDRMVKVLPELKEFILPGGSQIAAFFHLARTVCRRAERVAVRLHEHEAIAHHIIIYLNRLSDYLFVAARFANHLSKISDVHWVKPPSP